MKNIRLLFFYLGILGLLFFLEKPIFATTINNVYDCNVESNKTDTVELECFTIRNKDLMAILDSVIMKRGKSPFHFFEYKFRICTDLMNKDGDTVVLKNDMRDVNKHNLYWLIRIELHEGENFAENNFDWGVLRYKNQSFALACRPCDILFYPLEKKEKYLYIEGEKFYGFLEVMSWTYKYCDNKFVFLEYKKYS